MGLVIIVFAILISSVFTRRKMTQKRIEENTTVISWEEVPADVAAMLLDDCDWM